MNYDQIAFHLENSSTVKLLRSEHAPLVLSFFHYAFKEQHRTVISFDEIKQILKAYLENLSETQVTQVKKFTGNAEYYLNLWCGETHRFLRKYYDYESDSPLVELTYDAERAMEWAENLEKKEFVGTHSRFSMIFENLQTLATEADASVATRLKYLEGKRSELSEEIKTIKTTGTFKRMESTELKERFLNLIEDSRRLISDFSLVEEIFKELTQKIKEQKLKEFVTKGSILGQILDAYDYLEKSDQGQSFTAFWNFLMSANGQSELSELIKKTLKAPEIEALLTHARNQQHANFLRKFKFHLLQAGQRVLKSKFRLSEELRKLLHQKSLLDNKQVVEEIVQIKKILLENKDSFLARPVKDFLGLDYLPATNLPMERPLWSIKASTSFVDACDLGAFSGSGSGSGSGSVVDNEGELQENERQEMQLLKDFYYIDLAELERRLEIALAASGTGQITLAELSELYPFEKGVAEAVGYLDLAQGRSAEGVCVVNDDTISSLFVSSRGGELSYVVKIPQVIFLSSARSPLVQ